MIKKTYIRNKETVHNFFWRSIQVFGKQGVIFLIFFISSYLLSPYEFGVYNYILAIVFFLIVFGDFGISIATSKFVAEYGDLKNEKSKLILFNSALIILVVSLIICFLVILFGKPFLQDKYVYILFMLPVIVLAPLTSLYDGIYRGLKKFKQLSAISTIVGILSLSYVYILIKLYGLIGALIAQNLFYLMLLVVLFMGHKEKIRWKLDKNLIKEISGYSTIVGLATIGQFLYTRVDILVLGHFNLIEEIGYYEIVNKIFSLLILPALLLSTVVAPNSTKNFHLKKYGHIKNKIIKEISLLFSAGLILSLITYLIAPIILKIAFAKYDSFLLMQMLTLILIILPLRYFSSYISGAYIVAGGYAKLTTITITIFGIVNFILDIVLIKIFGFIGVIYATVLSQIGYIAVKDLYFYFKIIRKLK